MKQKFALLPLVTIMLLLATTLAGATFFPAWGNNINGFINIYESLKYINSSTGFGIFIAFTFVIYAWIITVLLVLYSLLILFGKIKIEDVFSKQGKTYKAFAIHSIIVSCGLMISGLIGMATYSNGSTTMWVPFIYLIFYSVLLLVHLRSLEIFYFDSKSAKKEAKTKREKVDQPVNRKCPNCHSLRVGRTLLSGYFRCASCGFVTSFSNVEEREIESYKRRKTACGGGTAKTEIKKNIKREKHVAGGYHIFSFILPIVHLAVLIGTQLMFTIFVTKNNTNALLTLTIIITTISIVIFIFLAMKLCKAKIKVKPLAFVLMIIAIFSSVTFHVVTLSRLSGVMKDYVSGVRFEGSYKYTIVDGTAEVAIRADRKINIPAKIGGSQVGNFEIVGDRSIIQEVVIEDGLEILPASAFQNCKSIKEITIPTSVRSIGKNAFTGCSSLASVTSPWFGDISLFIDSPVKTFELSSYNYYRHSTVIDCYSFFRNEKDPHNFSTNIESITIGNGIKQIDEDAFYNLYSLKKIYISSTVTSVENAIIENCPNVTIYCQASEKPIGWSVNWNYNNYPVVWGYSEGN